MLEHVGGMLEDLGCWSVWGAVTFWGYAGGFGLLEYFRYWNIWGARAFWGYAGVFGLLEYLGCWSIWGDAGVFWMLEHFGGMLEDLEDSGAFGGCWNIWDAAVFGGSLEYLGFWIISGAAGVFRGCWSTSGMLEHLEECWSIGMLQHLGERRAVGEGAGTVWERWGDAAAPGGRAVLLTRPCRGWHERARERLRTHVQAPRGCTRVCKTQPRAIISHVAAARGRSRNKGRRGRRGRARARLPAAVCNFSRASARGRSKSTFSPVFLPGGLQPVSC